VSDLPPDSIVAKQWRAGLLKLGTMFHSDRVSPETTEFAEWRSPARCHRYSASVALLLLELTN
jgi:hypothetical protein